MDTSRERVGYRDQEPEHVMAEITNALALIKRVKSGFSSEQKAILRKIIQTALGQEELK